MKYVEEWHSVDLSSGMGKLAMGVIFSCLAAVLFSRPKWRLDEVLLMGFALWAGLSHVRLLFFTGLIVAPVLAPRLQLFPPYEPETDKPWLNAGIMAAVVGWMVLAFPSSAKLQEHVKQELPATALAFMQQRHLGGRIFNQYGWGGYMEWNTPGLKPFIDGRADIFVYNGTFGDYAKAISIQAPFEILDKYKIDYVLLSPDVPLTHLLEHSPSWHPIYADKIAVLLARTSSSGTAAAPLKAE
jgi:hypothetical protein